MIPFQRFLDEQRDVVWRFAVATVGRQEADDVFQETFLAALRRLPAAARELQHWAWVLTIAHRKASTTSAPASAVGPARRRARGRPPRAGPADDALWAQVRGLPDKQRAAVALRYAADLDFASIARALRCSEEAARRSAHEGIKKLRQEALA